MWYNTPIKMNPHEAERELDIKCARMSADMDQLVSMVQDYITVARMDRILSILEGKIEPDAQDVARIFTLAKIGLAVTLLKGTGKEV